MKHFLSLLLFIAGTLLAVPVHTSTYRLDLAEGTGERTFKVQVGEELAFEIVNRGPKLNYSVNVASETVALPSPEPPVRATSPPSACDILANKIQDAGDESEVLTLVLQARHEKCDTSVTQNTTTPLSQKFKLAEDELVRITVRRHGGKAEVVKEWIFVFSPIPRGRWFTSYGFVFLGDQDKTFFSKETADGKFVITEKRKSGGELSSLKFAPSFFYTWLPRHTKDCNWDPGATFGLGFNQSDPVLFAGGSLLYNRFASLIAGAAIHKQKQLNGRYRTGQPLATSLADDALTEDKFGINYFIGVSFRFGSNPFSNGQADAPKQAQPAKTPEKE